MITGIRTQTMAYMPAQVVVNRGAVGIRESTSAPRQPGPLPKSGQVTPIHK